MRVLLVSHNFLPRHRAGTEIYTWQLGCELSARGHEVEVFTSEKEVSLPDLSLRRREVEGLTVNELINNLFFEDFRQTWDRPEVDRIFGAELDRYQPELVHFQHLMNLSAGCIGEAWRRGIPVVFTLHDYWLQCARFGQRVHADGSVCHEIVPERCGGCLAGYKWRMSDLEQRTGRVLAGLRRATGLDLGPPLTGLANVFRGRGNGGERRPEPDAGEAAEMARRISEREEFLREHVLGRVQRFISPSSFLRERFVEWGIPPERIDYRRIGVDLSRFQPIQREPADRLRVGFIGVLHPLKGVHVLLEAWGRLPEELRARGELSIFGPEHHYPSYQRELREAARRSGARLRGALSRDEVAGALREVDLMVVPSVWYENSPLTILEGLATHTPLLVSDLGGMAELVEPGVTGFHFRMGDAEDLAAHLARFLERPEELGQLYAEPVHLTRVEEDAVAVLEIYERAIEEVRG